MQGRILRVLLLSQLALTASVSAATDPVMTAVPEAAAATMPQRGLTMLEVEQAWGTPNRKASPVGSPPVSRWTYPGFTVYFEREFVIHAVVDADAAQP